MPNAKWLCNAPAAFDAFAPFSEGHTPSDLEPFDITSPSQFQYLFSTSKLSRVSRLSALDESSTSSASYAYFAQERCGYSVELGSGLQNMPERRSLRSKKADNTTSSANGDTVKSNSQSSSSNKDKPQPARSTSSRSKSFSKKKSINSTAEDTNGDKPHINGSTPVENDIDGAGEPEVDDQESTSASLKQSGKDKDGDEEMTVVVPPSKASKISGSSGPDEDIDTAMSGTEASESKIPDDAVDPEAKAVDSMYFPPKDIFEVTHDSVLTSEQLSRLISVSSRKPYHNSTLDSRSEYSGQSRPSASISRPMCSLKSSQRRIRLLVPQQKAFSIF